MISQDNEVEYSTIMNIGGNLDVRDVVFQGDFEPEPYEWITIKLVKNVDNML